MTTVWRRFWPLVCVVRNNSRFPAVKNNNTAYHAFGKYWIQARGFLNYRLKYCRPKFFFCACQPNELKREIKEKSWGPWPTQAPLYNRHCALTRRVHWFHNKQSSPHFTTKLRPWVHLLPKALRFEHGGAKPASSPGAIERRYAPAHGAGMLAPALDQPPLFWLGNTCFGVETASSLQKSKIGKICLSYILQNATAGNYAKLQFLQCFVLQMHSPSTVSLMRDHNNEDNEVGHPF